MNSHQEFQHNKIICGDFSQNSDQIRFFQRVNVKSSRENILYLEPRNLRHGERIIDLFKTLFNNKNKA